VGAAEAGAVEVGPANSTLGRIGPSTRLLAPAAALAVSLAHGSQPRGKGLSVRGIVQRETTHGEKAADLIMRGMSPVGRYTIGLGLGAIPMVVIVLTNVGPAVHWAG